MTHFLTAAAPALAIAAALSACSHTVSADEAPKNRVEQLMPQLLADDDAVRTAAERKLLALGAPARAELERMTRSEDCRKAVTALRLLQSPKWNAAPASTPQVHAPGDGGVAGSTATDAEFRDRVSREIEDMRRRIDDAFTRGFSFEIPEPGADLHGQASGVLIQNECRAGWSLNSDGRIKVTLQDGKGAPEKTYEAKDFAELKRAHPDVARRVEDLLPRNGGGGFWFRFTPFGDGPGGAADNPEDREVPQAAPSRAATPPMLGIEWTAPSESLRAQLGLSDAGMVVESVIPDSLASRIGIQRHDVLTHVNGRAVAGSEAVREAMESVKTGEPLKVEVVRKGKSLTLETKR